MGLPASTLRHLLSNQSLDGKCYPISQYISFPKDEWTVGQDGLLTDFHILPDKLQRGPDNDGFFWWSDAQFVPFKDTCLFASTTAFQPRPNRQWATVSHMPSGRVLLYQLDSPERMKCNIFSRTNSSVFPKMVPHPLGEMVAYCGTGEVVVMTKDGDPIYSRSRDLTNSVHVYCAVANNGVSFACLKRGMGVFFLETFILDTTIFGNDSVRCHQICPGFVPSKPAPDIVACKFSPDSKYIAVSSNRGYLFVVTRNKLQKFCVVYPEMVDEPLSSVESFDFHPRFAFEIMTLAIGSSNLQTVNIASGETLVSVDTEETVDCLTYSRDGLFIAVGLHTFNIKIYDSEDLSCTHSISMSHLCEDHMQRVQPFYPSVLRVSFSQNGEHLASSSCDGHLRLWRIPRLFSLQELCRDKILTCLPVKNVKNLKILPDKMKKFLLYNYL